MEIHAPDKPILTVKEAAVHLCIVTIGILIALSLEGLVEWRHHRALVREARANIASEMRDNRNELRNTRDKIDAMAKRLGDAADAVESMGAAWNSETATKLFDPKTTSYFVYGYTVAELTRASYSTAQATGAVGYMDYAEVKGYSEIYDFQDTYTRQQMKAFDHVTAAAAIGLGMMKKASPQDIQATTREMRLAMGELVYEKTFATLLLRAYDRALNGAQ